MEKIALITDSSCDLPKFMIERYNINVLPLHVIFKDQEYRDGVDISSQELYEKLPLEIPKTSMPSIGEAVELLENLQSAGYTHALAVLISKGLSGTFSMVDSLKERAQEIGITLTVIDSRALSLGLGFMVTKSAQLLEEGLTVQEVANQMLKLKEKARVFFVVKSLEYLRKGGRIGLVEGTLGDILDIKPIVSINEEGIYYTVDKVRGRNKSLNRIIDIAVEAIGDQTVNLGIVHGAATEEAQMVFDKIKGRVKTKEMTLTMTGPAMGVHTGPGLIGITYCPA